MYQLHLLYMKSGRTHARFVTAGQPPQQSVSHLAMVHRSIFVPEGETCLFLHEAESVRRSGSRPPQGSPSSTSPKRPDLTWRFDMKRFIRSDRASRVRQTAPPAARRGSRLPLLASALVLAALLAGTAGALPGRNTVDANDVQRNAITSKQIRNGQVKAADLARPESWHVVGRPGQPQFFKGGEGDCVWKSDPSSTYAPTSFRKDPFGRVHLRGVAFASDGPGGDGKCDSSQPDEAEDGVVFVLPRGYRPQYVSLSAVVYQIAAIPPQGAVFATGPVQGGAVFSAGQIAAVDDAEFDPAPAGSARRAKAPAQISLPDLRPLGAANGTD